VEVPVSPISLEPGRSNTTLRVRPGFTHAKMPRSRPHNHDSSFCEACSDGMYAPNHLHGRSRHPQLGTLKGARRSAAELFPASLTSEEDHVRCAKEEAQSGRLDQWIKGATAVAYINAPLKSSSRGGRKENAATDGTISTFSTDGKKLLMFARPKWSLKDT